MYVYIYTLTTVVARIFTIALVVSNITTFIMLTFKIYVKVTEYNTRNDVFGWQISL